MLASIRNLFFRKQLYLFYLFLLLEITLFKAVEMYSGVT